MGLPKMPQGPAATHTPSAGEQLLLWVPGPAPPICSKPPAENPPPVCSTPTIKLVAHTLCRRPPAPAPIQVPSFHSPLTQLPFLGPQPKLVLSCLLFRDQQRLHPGISLPRLFSPGPGGPCHRSQGPSPPSLPEAPGSARLINKVPWQPGAGRVADGRTSRGRVAAAGPAPRPCREGLPVRRPIPRGLEG